ncbi:MAG: cytochrome c maturation protein CcmE [Candidatus Eisenbacteria bacterium]
MSKRKHGKFLIGIALVLGTVAWLAFTGFEESKAYYRTVEEVQELGEAVADQRLKVGGDVQDGSIEWKGKELHFRLAQEEHVIPVIYVGTDPVPDTFKDGSQAVVEGKMRPDGTLEAVKIQAKCASKYEADYSEYGEDENAGA